MAKEMLANIHRGLTSQWSGRLRAAHSGAAHRRVRYQRGKVVGGLRMEPRNSERSQASANFSRVFYAPESSSPMCGSAIRTFRSSLASKRAKPKLKAQAAPGRLQVHRSLIFPLRFVRASSIGRPERCSSHDGCAIQLLSSVLVSERAGPRHMKSIVRGPPLSNQPLERTLASCALSLPLQGTACKRRSRAC